MCVLKVMWTVMTSVRVISHTRLHLLISFHIKNSANVRFFIVIKLWDRLFKTPAYKSNLTLYFHKRNIFIRETLQQFYCNQNLINSQIMLNINIFLQEIMFTLCKEQKSQPRGLAVTSPLVLKCPISLTDINLTMQHTRVIRYRAIYSPLKIFCIPLHTTTCIWVTFSCVTSFMLFFLIQLSKSDVTYCLNVVSML